MSMKSLMKNMVLGLMKKEQYIGYLRKKGVIIGFGCDIEKDVNFGSEPFLVTIGNKTRISHGVEFITHDGGIWVLRNLGLVDSKSVKYGSIHIGNNVNIGWNVIVMPGCTIGDNCVIAAGAVLTKSTPPNSIWGGVPAKMIESIDNYYEKNKSQLVPTFGMSTEDKFKYLKTNRPDLFGIK